MIPGWTVLNIKGGIKVSCVLGCTLRRQRVMQRNGTPICLTHKQTHFFIPQNNHRSPHFIIVVGMKRWVVCVWEVLQCGVQAGLPQFFLLDLVWERVFATPSWEGATWRFRRPPPPAPPPLEARWRGVVKPAGYVPGSKILARPGGPAPQVRPGPRSWERRLLLSGSRPIFNDRYLYGVHGHPARPLARAPVMEKPWFSSLSLSTNLQSTLYKC